MPTDDRTVWNHKYAEAPGKWLEPDAFLLRACSQFLTKTPPGSALDVAGGAGRQAIWLAQQGWKVTIIDVSDVGLQLAKENAARTLGPARAEDLISRRSADLRSLTDLGLEQYDLAIVFFFLRRKLFPALVRALKPGGTLIYRTYTLAQLGFDRGPRDPRYLLQPGELRKAFSDLEILLYEESVKDKGVAELVARKPAKQG